MKDVNPITIDVNRNVCPKCGAPYAILSNESVLVSLDDKGIPVNYNELKQEVYGICTECFYNKIYVVRHGLSFVKSCRTLEAQQEQRLNEKIKNPFFKGDE